MNKKCTKATRVITTAAAIAMTLASPAQAATGYKGTESNPRMNYTPTGLILEWDLLDDAGHPYGTESYSVWETEWLYA